MKEPFNPVGNYQVFLYEETHMLTNCLLAIAEYRKQMGEYWPSYIILSRNNRLVFGFGQGIKIRRAGPSDSWIINNAIYMSKDNPLRDPAVQRRATTYQGKREPVVDVYQQVYRIRTNTSFVMKLPAGD